MCCDTACRDEATACFEVSRAHSSNSVWSSRFHLPVKPPAVVSSYRAARATTSGGGRMRSVTYHLEQIHEVGIHLMGRRLSIEGGNTRDG
jgi:hypothetical protein